MAFTLLVATPLSEAYDFIGAPSHGLRAGDDGESSVEEIVEDIPVEEVPLQEDLSNLIEEPESAEEVEQEPVEEDAPAEEEPVEEVPVDEVVEPVIVKSEPVKEKPATPKSKSVSPTKPTPNTAETKLPELTGNIASNEYLDFVEYNYDTFSGNNPMDKLPPSKDGSYVIVYRSSSCPYCDKLISELKHNIGDYVLVSIRCNGTVRDLFYARWISAYPAFIVIKNRRVMYYGYGYRTLEEFKKLL